MGIVVRSYDSDSTLVAPRSRWGFVGFEVEEAKACLFRLKCALDVGIDHLIMEGDYLALVQKLMQRNIQDNCIDFFINDVLLVNKIQFYFVVFCHA